ncbi:MAG TPA: Fur family transcriptional regulator [Gaiellaceae bacterium]|jgi:Fur family ferric uptake transcriptional regulator|nr:Fur family transcriptional regulator [Gaiellaceae bacterium]
MRTGIILPMSWAEHARQVLREAGVKPGAARTAVIDVVADQRCCLSAPAIHDEVRRRRPGVGLASVYRALQTLTELGLVHRLDLRSGGAQYEPAQPSGDHHHHLVCGDCGKVEAFSDDRLERAIGTLSEASAFRIDEHDVLLRGRCEGCA